MSIEEAQDTLRAIDVTAPPISNHLADLRAAVRALAEEWKASIEEAQDTLRAIDVTAPPISNHLADLRAAVSAAHETRSKSSCRGHDIRNQGDATD